MNHKSDSTTDAGETQLAGNSATATVPTTRELRNFAFVIAGGFILIFGLLVPWLRGVSFPWWPWLLGLVMIVWAFVHSPSLSPLYRAWMKLGEIMHRIVNPIILGIVFFGMFVPIGFLKRYFSGDAMRRELDEETDSFRVTSEETPTEQMEKPF